MMIKKHVNPSLEGQISIFDLVLNDVKEPKKEYVPIVKSHKDKFAEIINLYSSSAARIVKQVCGALLVELEEKTLYFNCDGVKELELKKDMELLPADEILVVNQDRKLNDLQMQKLKDRHITEYIKRKGDANIIIQQPEKTIIINPKGWVLEYLQKPRYKDDEVYFTKTNCLNNAEASDFKENDLVEIEYAGVKHKGKIERIYNNGETINVSWDGKQTAFYYQAVRKIS